MPHISRREFLKTAASVPAIALGGCVATGGSGRRKRPNVLFIFTDQQTARAASFMGNPHLKTPAMDALAAKGVAFENSYCTSPLCAPSRISLITSRMPHGGGVNYNGDVPRADIPNMGEVFRSAGYRTVWAGKWHLPESYPLRAKSKQREIQGFEMLRFYDPRKDYPEWGYGDTTDEPLADAVADFLTGYNDEKPLLLAVSFCNPHDICYYPRQPERFPKPEEIKELPPLPGNFDVDPNEPEMVQQRRQLDYYGEEISYTKDWEPKRWQGYIHEYYRMTERVDKQIGRVLDALREKGLEEDTLIVLTSDHGDGCGSHRWAAKLNFYQEAMTVPLIVNWKGRIPAARIDSEHLVCGLDVLPTMCDYTGIRQPKGIRGRSLRSIIETPNAKWREYVVAELAPDPQNKTHNARMIRTRRYKYNVYSAGARNEQLFDLIDDPGEMHNLAYELSMQDVREHHRQLLKKWVTQTGDDFTAGF